MRSLETPADFCFRASGLQHCSSYNFAFVNDHAEQFRRCWPQLQADKRTPRQENGDIALSYTRFDVLEWSSLKAVVTIETAVSEIDLFISSTGNFNIITWVHLKVWTAL